MQKEKGKICVSIIVPTHRLSPERRVDKLEVERALDNARQFLQFKYAEPNIKPLLQALDELYQDIDFTHNSDGLGLYVSPNIKFSVQFPFPVEEKVMVGDNFELRDLLYKVNYANPYFVLLLTEKRYGFLKVHGMSSMKSKTRIFQRNMKKNTFTIHPAAAHPIQGMHM